MLTLIPLGMSGHLPEYEYASTATGGTSVAGTVVLLSISVVADGVVVVEAESVTFSELSPTCSLFNNLAENTNNIIKTIF